jgi:hypothetical protein
MLKLKTLWTQIFFNYFLKGIVWNKVHIIWWRERYYLCMKLTCSTIGCISIANERICVHKRLDYFFFNPSYFGMFKFSLTSPSTLMSNFHAKICRNWASQIAHHFHYKLGHGTWVYPFSISPPCGTHTTHNYVATSGFQCGPKNRNELDLEPKLGSPNLSLVVY